MCTKVLLCLAVSLVLTGQIAKGEDVAYSSVYTSLGSHSDTKEDTAITYGPIDENVQSTPILETVVEEETSNAGLINDNTNANDAQKIAPGSIIYSIPNVQAIPSIQPVTAPLNPKVETITTSTSNNVKSSNPVFSPAFIGKSRLTTPGLSAFASSGKEYQGGQAKITIVESSQATKTLAFAEPEIAEPTIIEASISKDTSGAVSQTSDADSESHISFDGFGASYSW